MPETPIWTTQHKRLFLAYGGARKGNAVQYAGQEATYTIATGVSAPQSGGVDPIHNYDPSNPGKYIVVGTMEEPPDLAKGTLTFRERRHGIPRQLLANRCAITAYLVSGSCSELGDFIRGWDGYINVLPYGIVTDKDLGDRMSFDSDEEIQDEVTLHLRENPYPVGVIYFGEKAATQVAREIVDVTYGRLNNCQGEECGPQFDPTRQIYALSKSDQVPYSAEPTEYIYTLDGGATWTEVQVGDGSDVPVAIRIVGENLLIVCTTCYYYAAINQLTGVPGTLTKVTPTAWATNAASDVFVLTQREIFFSAANGYVYKSSNLAGGVTASESGSATSEDLSRISGAGDTLVAVGANGAIIVSNNRGRTWASVTTSPEAATIQAVGLHNKYRWWVGTATGNLYYTENGAETWFDAETFTGAGTGAVEDIVVINDEVLHVSHTTADSPTAARLLTSWNGGQDWDISTTSKRLANVPVFSKATRMAYPSILDTGRQVNYLVIGGVAGDEEDGVILVGEPNIT